MGTLPYWDLIVWQRSRVLAGQVFGPAESPPFRTRSFDRDQMCRAAMSVPANVAGGNGRASLDYAAFNDRAHGSRFELDTWLLVAADRGWLSQSDWQDIENEIGQISALLKALGDRLRTKRSLESRTS